MTRELSEIISHQTTDPESITFSYAGGMEEISPAQYEVYATLVSHGMKIQEAHTLYLLVGNDALSVFRASEIARVSPILVGLYLRSGSNLDDSITYATPTVARREMNAPIEDELADLEEELAALSYMGSTLDMAPVRLSGMPQGLRIPQLYLDPLDGKLHDVKKRSSARGSLMIGEHAGGYSKALENLLDASYRDNPHHTRDNVGY